MWKQALYLACVSVLLHGAASSEVLDSVTLEQAQVGNAAALVCKRCLSPASPR